MKPPVAAGVTAIGCLAAGAACLIWWLGASSGRGTAVRLEPRPAPARSAAATATNGNRTGAATVAIGAVFATFDGTPSALAAKWPRFRGPHGDNIASNSPPLAESFRDTNGPPVLWSVPLGEGYAGPAVANGCVYVLDYMDSVPGDMLRCFSLDDGRERWRRGYELRVKRNHGMSRTVPAVTADDVVTIGPRCHVMCVDARTGALRWGLDLVRDHGTREPMWYTAQCPLIDEGIAVIAPAGRVLMMGVECSSGRVVWETPNPRGWQMSHASIVPMVLGGRRQYVYAAIGGMAGVAADGEDRGTVLWETTDWNHAVVAPSPVPLPGGRILVTAGYGAGSRMFQVEASNGVFAVHSLFALDRKVFACEQHTPIWYRDRLLGVLPADAGAMKQQLVALNLDGTVAWASGPEQRFGLGPFLVADDKLFLLGDDGLLTVARAAAESFTPLARARVLFGKEAWAPMAVVDGRLILRDSERMVCLYIGVGEEGAL